MASAPPIHADKTKLLPWPISSSLKNVVKILSLLVKCVRNCFPAGHHNDWSCFQQKTKILMIWHSSGRSLWHFLFQFLVMVGNTNHTWLHSHNACAHVECSGRSSGHGGHCGHGSMHCPLRRPNLVTESNHKSFWNHFAFNTLTLLGSKCLLGPSPSLLSSHNMQAAVSPAHLVPVSANNWTTSQTVACSWTSSCLFSCTSCCDGLLEVAAAVEVDLAVCSTCKGVRKHTITIKRRSCFQLQGQLHVLSCGCGCHGAILLCCCCCCLLCRIVLPPQNQWEAPITQLPNNFPN